MTVREWQRGFKLGHVYFSDGQDVAVADDSMRDRNDPATQDDGLLWLDRSRPVLFKATNRVSIPLRDDDGKVCATEGDWLEGIKVVREFAMRASFDRRLAALAEIMVHP